jgi:hypothetical protein
MADMPAHVHDAHPAPALSRAHETADVDGRRIWQTAAALAATIVGAGFLASGALRLFHDVIGRPLSPIDAPPAKMAAPRLQSAPTLDLQALREEKRALLNEYRWIDRDHGVVRIPIEQAMSLLIARSPAKPR